MLLKILIPTVIAISGQSALAESQYSLTCDMDGRTAHVYACNSGNSSEGNNRYVTVKSCVDGDCDDDYDLMYIYSAAGECEEVGTIDFDEDKDFCLATFRE